MWFRIKHKALTDEGPLTTAERIVRMEQDRRAAAFERAVAEMARPNLTTETILDLYLAEVAR